MPPEYHRGYEAGRDGEKLPDDCENEYGRKGYRSGVRKRIRDQEAEKALRADIEASKNPSPPTPSSPVEASPAPASDPTQVIDKGPVPPPPRVVAKIQEGEASLVLGGDIHSSLCGKCRSQPTPCANAALTGCKGKLYAPIKEERAEVVVDGLEAAVNHYVAGGDAPAMPKKTKAVMVQAVQILAEEYGIFGGPASVVGVALFAGFGWYKDCREVGANGKPPQAEERRAPGPAPGAPPPPAERQPLRVVADDESRAEPTPRDEETVETPAPKSEGEEKFEPWGAPPPAS